MDGTPGGIISHSLVGASRDYSDRFFGDLPKLFNPRKYNPDEWAELAKLAGMQPLLTLTAKDVALTVPQP